MNASEYKTDDRGIVRNDNGFPAFCFYVNNYCIHPYCLDCESYPKQSPSIVSEAELECYRIYKLFHRIVLNKMNREHFVFEGKGYWLIGGKRYDDYQQAYDAMEYELVKPYLLEVVLEIARELRRHERAVARLTMRYDCGKGAMAWA